MTVYYIKWLFNGPKMNTNEIQTLDLYSVYNTISAYDPRLQKLKLNM